MMKDTPIFVGGSLDGKRCLDMELLAGVSFNANDQTSILLTSGEIYATQYPSPGKSSRQKYERLNLVTGDEATQLLLTTDWNISRWVKFVIGNILAKHSA